MTILALDIISVVGMALVICILFLCFYINFYNELRREIIFRSGTRSSRISPELLHTISIVIRERQARHERMMMLQREVEMTEFNKKYDNVVVIINPGNVPSLGTYE